MSHAIESTARPAAPGPREDPGSLSFSYHDLRSLAEYASSIRGRDVYFIRGEKGWEAHDSTRDLPVGAQAIHVFNPATPEHPHVHRARIWSDDVTGEGYDLLNVPDPETGKLVPADAVFWSESAVEKFLVPYYASVYGDQANVAVDKLLKVFHPRKGEQAGEEARMADGAVLALAHIPRSEYVTVSNDASLLVLVKQPEDGRWAVTLQEHAEGRQG
jgi:hypothetical protein